VCVYEIHLRCFSYRALLPSQQVVILAFRCTFYSHDRSSGRQNEQITQETTEETSCGRSAGEAGCCWC